MPAPITVIKTDVSMPSHPRGPQIVDSSTDNYMSRKGARVGQDTEVPVHASRAGPRELILYYVVLSNIVSYYMMLLYTITSYVMIHYVIL